ncbi:23S rRNA (uracil(1939)-C(5))-methyltransferase [Luteibacter rhizovicinus DSM 16549]|uniref:23S rRNA (uracil(1939)-C(5))-methyltransferase RlmD n=1 Tax=Luteibacter rhizovicinus DSM 16549 TaxID=1440763 RepID=A0A0G9HDS1_9GAMM|nr:23S rRNA (uracil(1939)-C(5))-methyltransferase RlmD [Luteibacter rhizovicinus]APG05285.1 23S rRNA (uracil(1939)-C(5))-methyltransferase [Luteibacter rhizovicinus DSM 16549]KLD67905.1 23S rRNA methyltransferase [Luteibacter rhizovicinus DSM 16549]KLD74808.1 23S rRNA methyltransferase [Xanthomonas hyacinthi DSM 19077]
MTELEATITDLTHDVRGVARIDNKATFVSGALPGERVAFRYVKRHRNYDDAELVSVIEASPHRVEPKCRHFGLCSGCSLQHMDPEAQIAAKQRVLAENFERIGKVMPARWLPPLSDQPWAYRRKGRFSVRYVAKMDRVLVGFREESNPRLVADIEHCEVIHPALGPKVGLLANLVSGMEAARDIPQIEFAAGDDTVALVFRHVAPLSERDRATLVAFGREHGFAIYLQPGNASSVHPLWPEAPRLAFTVPADNVELEFLPLDFVQVNAGMNTRMLARSMELLDLQPADRVLDLFCGLGNFTLPMARHAAEVVGVEGEHGLVERAAANAARNGLANASFRVANLFEDQRSAPWASERWDKILLDPPRAGADKVLEYLPRKGTHRIVYVSCHPGSLARDAGILVQKHGFKLVSAGVMDMFPHTAHVESIALFERG